MTDYDYMAVAARMGALCEARAAEAPEQKIVPACKDKVEVIRQEIGYVARMLTLATLPHREPPKGTHSFSRRNGNFTLKVVCDPEFGLPFGVYPRLMMAVITSKAVREQSRHISLGRSLTAFASEMGLSMRGGERGTIVAIRDQFQRLVTSTISFTYDGDGDWVNAGFRPIEETTLTWDASGATRIKENDTLITLNERFYRDLVKAPVPIDVPTLRALAKLRSPLAIDVYQWLTHRVSYLKKPTTIPWDLLLLQFGGDYARVRKFKEKFVTALQFVVARYPEVRATVEGAGLRLDPCATHVRRLR